ncbi:MAG: tyrosine-protein phosphatase, partial [Muribaculaceae bacterium]|nr:tyrosine-protein phosphatase [Muribaculaceae bacterium]
RHKDGKTGITEYQSQGSSTPNKAYIYANGEQKKIKYIYEEGYDYDFAKESGQSSSNLTLSNGLQIPYNSTNFSRAFGEFGMYENELEFTVASDGVATIGIKNELSGSSYRPYIAYDNFRLYRIDEGGSTTPTDPTEPTDPEEPTEPEEPGEMTGVVELYNLNAPAGTLVPVCMPYAVKSSYFGQVYTIGSIQNGQATIVPVDEVATGVPCVVKSSGASTIKKGDVTVNTSTRPKTFSLWDNTLMQATSSFTGYTWTATDIYNNTINASDLTFVEGDLTNLEFTASIENNAVARFWAQNPTYLAETPSTVGNYLSDPVYNSSSRRDKPNPVLVPVVVSSSQQTLSYWEDGSSDKQSVTVAASKNVAEIYELTPGVTYNYQCGQAKGRFTVSGTIRMLNIGTNVANMRDLGGKKTVDGRYVRYGKIYRSAEFKGSTYNINTEEKNKLVALGIGAEIDLRNTDGGTTKSWIPNVKEGDNYFYA